MAGGVLPTPWRSHAGERRPERTGSGGRKGDADHGSDRRVCGHSAGRMGLSLSSIDLRSKLVESGTGEQCPRGDRTFFHSSRTAWIRSQTHLTGSLLSSVERVFLLAPASKGRTTDQCDRTFPLRGLCRRMGCQRSRAGSRRKHWFHAIQVRLCSGRLQAVEHSLDGAGQPLVWPISHHTRRLAKRGKSHPRVGRRPLLESL